MFATTIVNPTRIANGTMFTVQALKNVSISALSTYTSRIDDGVIQVYTRQGHYESYTQTEEGWKLVFDQSVHQWGMEKLTRIAFSDNQRVNIPAGGFASFYVYTTKNLSYQFSKTWSEGTTVVEDEWMKLFAGVALAYGKWEQGCGAASPLQDGQCVFAPRVFSGVFEYIPWTVTAPIHELQTLNRNELISNKGRGLMFTIRAKRNIVIQGFDIFARAHAAINILVYTRGGGFNDTTFEQWQTNTGSHDDFTLLYDGSIPNQGSSLFVLDDFKQNVRVTEGQTQTFYVFSQEGLKVGYGSELGSIYSEDSSIVIYEGRATKRFFERPRQGSWKWAGTIRYYND